MVAPINAPTLKLGVDDLVDWLELTALFNEFGISRLDDLLGALLELEESPEDDIGERDRRREQCIEALENEIELRTRSLRETYPFELGEGAEELVLTRDWRDQRFSYYLVCLVTTHVTGSPILRTPPANGLLTQLRNDIFQIIATLGMAGHAVGPAYSVGWPRRSGEDIVKLLERAAADGGGFGVRNPPGQYVSPDEKDGGIDVIAWTAEEVPPPSAFYFGQTASGRNWQGKPVSVHAEKFREAYMQDHMTGNRLYFTIIPFRVIDEITWNNESRMHGALLDRLRLPAQAWQGSLLAARGVPIDSADRVGELTTWLADFINYAQAA
jgi:hypothetical protein